MKTKSTVTLDHKSGAVKIDIEAQSPEVAAYIANRIKEIFGAKKGESFADELMRSMGFKP